ncbi:MAG: hypothetical protein ABW189_06945 [Rickettsiales bacterium]
MSEGTIISNYDSDSDDDRCEDCCLELMTCDCEKLDAQFQHSASTTPNSLRAVSNEIGRLDDEKLSANERKSAEVAYLSKVICSKCGSNDVGSELAHLFYLNKSVVCERCFLSVRSDGDGERCSPPPKKNLPNSLKEKEGGSFVDYECSTEQEYPFFSNRHSFDVNHSAKEPRKNSAYCPPRLQDRKSRANLSNGVMKTGLSAYDEFLHSFDDDERDEENNDNEDDDLIEAPENSPMTLKIYFPF